MKLKITAVAVALMLVATGAAAAMPGNAPDSAQADEHANGDHPADDHADNAKDAGADAVNESESDASESESDAGPPADVPAASQSENASDAGPPADLPAQVPDFVSQLHDLIREHVTGNLSGADLGAQLSDLLSGSEESADTAGGQ